METKYVRVPFDLELAKKITNGVAEGEIIDNYNNHYRLICFNLLDDKGRIIGLRQDNNYKETCLTFNDNGDCVQQYNLNLFLKIPEYITFKDGDIIAYDKYNTISIIQGDVKFEGSRLFAHYYVDFYNKNELSFYNVEIRKILNEARRATEEEKQYLIQALKTSKEPEAKKYLKQFFGIEEKQEFKPFDRVLVRDDSHDTWSADFYLFMVHKRYKCVGYIWKQCIPYNEDTAHLLGTNEDFNL